MNNPYVPDAGETMKRRRIPMPSSVEAVIISGPNRGEIIHLADEAVVEVSDEDMGALNEALDALIGAIERVTTEMRTTIMALRTPGRES
jgi:hypothetical protein